MNSNEFTVNIDEKDVVFKVRNPSFKAQREAQKIYNKSFSDALASGSIIRARLDEIMRKQGLWDEEKDELLKSLQNRLNNGEKRLSQGGITLDEAKKTAIDMRDARQSLKELISTKNDLDANTAEGQADNAKFNYLVSACVVYKEDDKPYFSGYEDYLSRGGDAVGIIGAQKLANMMYGLDDNFEQKLPENSFLQEYGFVNDDLDFVDSEGRLTDQNGRLIDQNGRYVDEDGNYIDVHGDRVDLKGSYITEFKPFLDAKGKPVLSKKQKEDKAKEAQEAQESAKSEVEEDKPKPKPRTRKPRKKKTETS